MGYPKTLIAPNTSYTMQWDAKDTNGETITKSKLFSFVPLVNLDDLPARNKYPINERNINEVNLDAATLRMGGDEQSTKLWWME